MAGKSRRLTGSEPCRPGGAVPGDDQQGDVNFVRVEAETMVEHAMLTKLFPMVGSNDHERVAEHVAPVELIEQRPDLPIQGGDAIVVGVAGQLHVALAELELVPIPVFQEHPGVAGRFGAEPEMGPISLGGEKGLVCVEIVQEGEEGPPAVPLSRQPVQKRLVDPLGVSGLGSDPFDAVEAAGV